MSSADKLWLVRLSNQTTGRDKLIRLVQYGSKFTSWLLVTLRPQAPNSGGKFKNLEGHMSMGRKLLRLGRCFEVLQSALGSIHHPDLVIRISVTFSRIATSLFLAVDHWIWWCRIALSRAADELRGPTELSNRLWLVSILCNLTRDFYELIQLLGRILGPKFESRHQGRSGRNRGDETSDLLETCYQEIAVNRRPLLLDTVKNLADLPLPMCALRMVALSPGAQGLLGVVSSCIALLVMSQPALKQYP